MKVLITGADGFIGKNLQLHLSERRDVAVVEYTRRNRVEELASLLNDVDFVFHLAGINRPKRTEEFLEGNTVLTEKVVAAIESETHKRARNIPILYASSTQATRDNDYGASKRRAELILKDYSARSLNPVYIFRLPNVFGKGCKPNYNSAVATFCHNIANDIPITIHDPDAALSLNYIDDTVAQFISIMDGNPPNLDSDGFARVLPEYKATVGEIAEAIKGFWSSRTTLVTERVGTGLLRALYATYVSYLPTKRFSYSVPTHADNRGVFVEMLKTPDCGQFSFFTARPGVTRGGHYHHTKTEKFLVIKGRALFKFRNVLSGTTYELITSGLAPEIVETVPSWTHDITNIGDDELVVMLWANEVFDPKRPDTYSCPV